MVIMNKKEGDINKMKEKGAIAIIPIKGMIMSEESIFGLMATSTEIIRDIEEVEKKRKIKAVIFEINSPGLSRYVTECQLMLQVLHSFYSSFLLFSIPQ